MYNKFHIYKEKKEFLQKEKSENITFASILFSKLKQNGLSSTDRQIINYAEPIAHLSYDEELKLKNEALKEYFRSKGISSKITPVEPSPRPRQYRTTSKRRVAARKGKVVFLMGEENEKEIIRENGRSLPEAGFKESVLEPEEHKKIYTYLNQMLSLPQYISLAGELNYIIVRGSYEEFCVIFNAYRLNSQVVRKLKLLAEHLKDIDVNVIAAFIYFDPTRSDYYFEVKRPEEQLGFKKLFGKDRVFVDYGKIKYSFYPTSFSQVNASIAPVMLQKAEELIKGCSSKRLVDLYCGYGLFSYYLAGAFTDVIGIDAAGSSINSAIESLKYFKRSYSDVRFRFLARRIVSRELDRILPLDSRKEIFILDPPRKGVEKDVIEAIALRGPEKVIHIFCGIEQIPIEIKRWNRSGYGIEKIIPLDMFPGTTNLEIMILLSPNNTFSS